MTDVTRRTLLLRALVGLGSLTGPLVALGCSVTGVGRGTAAPTRTDSASAVPASSDNVPAASAPSPAATIPLPPENTPAPPASAPSPVAGTGMMGGGRGMMGDGGMMGSATSADMSTYMDMFAQHTKLQRTVDEIPGGVRTTTESDDPELAAQLKTHVRSMYQHLRQGQEVRCMSSSLPTLFQNATGYNRQLTLTDNGVSVTETSDDPTLAQAIRDHANEISGFVQAGMPAMMRGMMGGA